MCGWGVIAAELGKKAAMVVAGEGRKEAIASMLGLCGALRPWWERWEPKRRRGRGEEVVIIAQHSSCVVGGPSSGRGSSWEPKACKTLRTKGFNIGRRPLGLSGPMGACGLQPR